MVTFLFQVPPSCCSSANFTCPDLSLNPTAVLPQVEQYWTTFSSLTSADGVWLFLCSPGGYCACSCSLSGSGCCFPVGRSVACLLPGKVLFSIDSDYSSPSPRMVATEKREWYELSDHWQGRRMVTNSLQLNAHRANFAFPQIAPPMENTKSRHRADSSPS